MSNSGNAIEVTNLVKRYKDLLALDVLNAAAFAEGAALAAKADNAAAAALLADAEHKKRGSAPKKRRYDFDF